jgi:hypothetical protein
MNPCSPLLSSRTPLDEGVVVGATVGSAASAAGGAGAGAAAGSTKNPGDS